MFRGSAPATVDEKGRLKIPTDFRRQLEERWGPEVFITSVLGDRAMVFPLSVWEDMENRLLSLPTQSPSLVATRARPPIWAGLLGDQSRASPVPGSIAPMPSRRTAPPPSLLAQPFGLSSHLKCPWA